MEKTSRPIWSGIVSGLLIAQLAAPAWAQNADSRREGSRGAADAG